MIMCHIAQWPGYTELVKDKLCMQKNKRMKSIQQTYVVRKKRKPRSAVN